VAAVYAFARGADDFADEFFLPPEERLARLAAWREKLVAGADGHGRHPVFWALSDAVDRLNLPLDPFLRLLTAFEMDVTRSRQACFDDLIFYCRHSANPVGELVLRIFGQWTPERGAWSDAICTGLQLANFWQDVTVDAQKDRLYIPLEDLAREGLSAEDALTGPATPALLRVMARLVNRTWGRFLQGKPLCDDPPPGLGKELRLVWLGGTRILKQIEARRGDVWSARPRLGWKEWMMIFPELLTWRKSLLPRSA
jgi:squalene synthase HpnC